MAPLMIQIFLLLLTMFPHHIESRGFSALSIRSPLEISSKKTTQCLIKYEKRETKSGQCLYHGVFCRVAGRLYSSDSCKAYRQDSCSVTIAVQVTAAGFCNSFGACRSDRKIRLDHPACRKIDRRQISLF
eukprot:TRINITY_DN11852_c0_g1_i1.p1 TRINITY_DN11852_c0_g1~~TRINITY_DN11852_c0_g1_i1.p1  ORF type:complete len:130 (-),score=18.14 TRINITY_DN11852_c0_g1_i1:30-419(-)